MVFWYSEGQQRKTAWIRELGLLIAGQVAVLQSVMTARYVRQLLVRFVVAREVAVVVVLGVWVVVLAPGFVDQVAQECVMVV